MNLQCTWDYMYCSSFTVTSTEGPYRLYCFTVQPEILKDPSYGTHNYVTANGIKFHYVANGTEGKPLMLFLHGFPEVSTEQHYQYG